MISGDKRLPAFQQEVTGLSIITCILQLEGTFKKSSDTGVANCSLGLIWPPIFFFFFWPRHVACRIFVLQSGTEPMPPALGVQSLNYWTTREVPGPHIFNMILFFNLDLIPNYLDVILLIMYVCIFF